jgi:hypothetical protein
VVPRKHEDVHKIVIMAIPKYICRCGNRTDKMTSYFINGIRVTACEQCEEEFKSIKDVQAVDYDVIKSSSKEERFYHMIDTREK